MFHQVRLSDNLFKEEEEKLVFGKVFPPFLPVFKTKEEKTFHLPTVEESYN